MVSMWVNTQSSHGSGKWVDGEISIPRKAPLDVPHIPVFSTTSLPKGSTEVGEDIPKTRQFLTAGVGDRDKCVHIYLYT